jgi:hypothetical protein
MQSNMRGSHAKVGLLTNQEPKPLFAREKEPANGVCKGDGFRKVGGNAAGSTKRIEQPVNCTNDFIC